MHQIRSLRRKRTLRDDKSAYKNPWVKRVRISYDSFLDEFNESQQLQERLNATVDELYVTVALLEQNLEKAQLLARQQRETRERSGLKTNRGKSSW